VSLSRPNHFQAQADPDGMTNDGVDQPGGAGGIDTSSQDGNNGSGNDADCEDDNRGVGVPGHCKDRPETPGTPTGDIPDDQTGGESGSTPDSSAVTQSADVAPGPAPSAMVSAPATSAGGSSSVVTRSQAAPAATPHTLLPNTGLGRALLGLAVAGLVALGGGGAVVARRRTAA
jgi:LPXTG-motif cell wall-anchored protein